MREDLEQYWKENNITRPKSTIVCAAIKVGTKATLIGPRHYDATMSKQMELLPAGYHSRCLREGKVEQGFIDQFGFFYNRVDAMAIVKANGQPFNFVRNGDQDKELYSEGLY